MSCDRVVLERYGEFVIRAQSKHLWRGVEGVSKAAGLRSKLRADVYKSNK